MGHSSGGQLAALMCTDDRYAKAEGFSLKMIKGCVPVDADTFDIPAIIEMAETRARVHQLPMPTFGHRQKFGDDPAKHRDFSTVTHVAKGKDIPPFLILHIAGNPDTVAQARRLENGTAGVGDFRQGRHRHRDNSPQPQRQHRRTERPRHEGVAGVRRRAEAVAGCQTVNRQRPRLSPAYSACRRSISAGASSPRCRTRR